MEAKFERVDGVDYEVDSEQHKQALKAKEDFFAELLVEGKTADKLDANQTVFLARDLTHVSQETQNVLYEKLRAAEFIPIKSEVPRGAQTHVYRQMDIRGEARVGAHLDADDAPTAEVAIEEFPHAISHVTASYQYSVKELEAAAFWGIPLNRDKANACAEIIARKLDQLMRYGNAALGVTGFFNNPNVPLVTLTNGEWLTGTAAEILADLAQLEQAVIDNSRDVHRADMMVLPSAYEGRLSTLPRDTNTDLSVGKWFLQNNRMTQRYERWYALDGATGTQVSAADPPQGVLYEMSPENVYAELPVPYEELTPEARNFGWVVNARADFGGVVIKRPLSMVYFENLD